jgi:uncharacterized protein YkwD
MKRKPRKRGADPQSGWNPKYLKQDVFAATAALVVCLFAGAGLLDRYIKETGSPYIAAVISAVLVELANDDRSAQALGELQVNPKLVAAAQAKVNDMAEKGYFAHETPEGYDSWHWFGLVNYEYSYAGENLAVDFTESADVEKAWMASPTHRANILNDRYTEIGIATAKGMYKGREAIFAVQMFGRPSAAELFERSAIAETPSAPVPTTSVAATPGATLGETTVEEEPIGALAEQDGDAVILSAEEIPWWGWVAAQPKQTLRYAYIIIGLLILGALFLDVEIEFKRHHVRHAMKAGMLLATMSMLFIAADWVFFAEPTLAMIGEFLQ